MRQRAPRAVCLLLLLLAGLCFGCGRESAPQKYETVTLNSVDTFYNNGTLLEANVRELTYDGNDASVRIRLTNIGDDPVDGIDASVRFVDANGNLLFEEPLHLAFEVALYKEETTSVTVAVNGADVRKIAAVSVVG